MSASRPPFGMFTTDTRLVVRTWDRFIAEITGIAAEQALGRPIVSVLPELEERGLLPIIRQVVSDGTVQVLAPAIHRYLIRCAPASPATSGPMQQRVTIGPVRDNNLVVGVAVTIEDVTARVERDHALLGRLTDATPSAEPLAAEAVGSLTRALGDGEWRTRQAAVRALADQGPAVVQALVTTLREQHRNFSVLSSLLDLLTATDIDVVEPLTACLKDEDVDLRIQAALILGERRDRRATPALIAALDDSDVNVRFHAIEALGVLHATEAVDRLVDIAAQGDFFLAFPALQALSRLGDVRVTPRLVPLLGNDFLRAAVAEVLGELGDEIVAAPLVTLLNAPNAPTEVIADALAGLAERYEHRYGAGEQIANVVRRHISPTGTQNLLDAVHRVSSDRLKGIARVMGWLNGQAVQRALTRLLGQQAVRAQVVEALVRYGAGVVDLLIDQLDAEDLDTRQAAAVALGRIGDRKATRPLVAALRDPELALPIAGALARLGDREAFEPLLGMLGHPDTAVRQAAVAALNSIGHPDMPSRVVRLLDDPDPIVRESALKITGYFGYRECADRALARCGDESEAVRRAAVDHLPFFEHPGVVPALADALARDTPLVRAAAAAAFARVDQEQAIGPLLGALKDEDPWVRYFAVRSIGGFVNSGVTSSVRDVLEHDSAGQVRLAAIDVLGRLGAPDAAAVLQPLTTSGDADIARAAIRALGHTRDTATRPVLTSLLRSPEPVRRLEAVMATAERADPDAATTLQWVAAADANRDVANAAIAALALLGSLDGPLASAATGALTALAAEPEHREMVVTVLAGLPARRIGDVAKGLRCQSTDVRRATIETLSRMKNPEASRWIETGLDDEAPLVRATAVAELRRLGSRLAAKKLLTLARTDPDPEVRRAAVMAVTQQRDDFPGAAPTDAP